jgi:alpha-beta hydrolase superfamily lysophospholipase
MRTAAWHDRHVRRLRTVTVALPAQIGRHDGLAYCLWLPEAPGTFDPLGVRLPANIPPRGGVVILHGAGSCKESHHDYARVLLAAGFAAITFDQRGHGESEGPMDGRARDDVVGMASRLRSASGDPDLPIALRGSSMGGYLAIIAAKAAGAGAVVAICPAPAESLVRGLRAGRFDFAADTDTLEAFLTSHDLFAAVESLNAPLLLMHAGGDEQVPVEHSRELIGSARFPGSRLIALPGGHHRSIQHDEEMQAVSVRFIRKALDRAR